MHRFQLALWINDNFLLQEEITCDANDKLDVKFYSLRGAGMLFIAMDGTGKVCLFSFSLALQKT